jgi:cysteine desulfurase
MNYVYFDNNATTPVRPEVFEAMRPFLSPDGIYGNPSSLHSAGQKAHTALETAREQVAALLGAADPSEIVFTSCGTEADNMALIGAAFEHRAKGRHLITSAVEHHAVLHTLDYPREKFSPQPSASNSWTNSENVVRSTVSLMASTEK